MISLKAFLPILALHTGLSVTALYERQRALVRLGLLPKPTKSGRNSGGAMATPGTVAVMLTAVLVTDKLSEMDERILEFLMLRSNSYNIENVKGREIPCPFTQERTFYRAFRAILADGQLSAFLTVEVVRDHKIARFTDKSGDYLPSEFGQVAYYTNLEHRVSLISIFDISCELEEANPTRPPEETTMEARMKRMAYEFQKRDAMRRIDLMEGD
jgi:hypothetical protein